MSCQTIDETVYVKIRRGDSLLLLVDLDAASTTEIDITGWSFLSQLRDANDIVVETMTVTPTDLLKGQVEVSLTDEQTDLLDPADYVFALQAADADGNERTLFDGALRIAAS